MRTSTQTQLFQYSICIQLAEEEVELIAKTPELWQWRGSRPSILSRHINKNILKGTAKKTKTNSLWIVQNYAM